MLLELSLNLPVYDTVGVPVLGGVKLRYDPETTQVFIAIPGRPAADEHFVYLKDLEQAVNLVSAANRV